MCNLSYSVPENDSIVFHNGSNFSHFIIKELAEEPEEWFTWLEESTDKCITFSVSIEKKLQKLIKKEKKSQRPYLTGYNLLIL